MLLEQVVITTMISHEFPRLGLLTFLTSCLLSHCPVRPGASSRGVSIDGNGCGARGRGKTHPPSPGGDGAPLAGTRTCRQELADRRGWSTFSKAWPVRRSDTAVARREAHVFFERGARLTERVSRLVGAPRPRHSCRGKDSPGPPVRGPKGNAGSPGAAQTTRAITLVRPPKRVARRRGCLKIESMSRLRVPHFLRHART